MLKKSIFLLFAAFATIFAKAQNDSNQLNNTNAAETLLNSNSKFTVGGYAQIDFNQPFSENQTYNAKLDIHRMVLLFGYQFNEKTRFVTEVEYEHVKEVYIEQAFINHEINPWLNFRGGLMLVPMGIINEYHEPTTFNGVERPNLDGKIVPSTWREIGAGFTGRIDAASLKYQVYVMNGFNGYNGSGTFRGSDGYRKGRQKGAESFMSSPTLATKIDYYGIKGLRLGLSTYNGKSQSTLYNGLDKNDQQAEARADSSVIGIRMVGIDARYKNRGFEARAQLNIANNKNTAEYNAFTGKDIGSQMLGWYAEVGYNLLQNSNSNQRLVPFVRYEEYDTHAKTAGSLNANPAYYRNEITVGAGWWLNSGTVLKADYQFFDNGLNENKGQLNLGIGIWF